MELKYAWISKNCQGFFFKVSYRFSLVLGMKSWSQVWSPDVSSIVYILGIVFAKYGLGLEKVCCLFRFKVWWGVIPSDNKQPITEVLEVNAWSSKG